MYKEQDKFIMENSQKLTAILLKKKIHLDLITKIVNDYIKIYSLPRYEGEDRTHFTAKNYYNVCLKEKYKGLI